MLESSYANSRENKMQIMRMTYDDIDNNGYAKLHVYRIGTFRFSVGKTHIPMIPIVRTYQTVQYLLDGTG